jgi:hypothetical protein
VSPDTGQIEFQNFEKGYELKASLYKNAEDDSWKPDMNQLILYCGDNVVGVCEFDLSSNIGTAPDYYFVMLVGNEYQVSDPSERVLKGDAETYPGAFIEFAVTCLPQNSEVTEAALNEAAEPKEDDKLSEEERRILSNENKKTMCNEYMNYLQNFKTIDDEE